MFNFTIKNNNKSIYFIELNTQWFWNLEVLYEISKTEIFLYNFLSNKILLKLISVPLTISSK